MVKEVCRRCIENYDVWLGADDKSWDKGRVYCPYSPDIGTQVTDRPPWFCHYVLEHAVLNQPQEDGY